MGEHADYLMEQEPDWDTGDGFPFRTYRTKKSSMQPINGLALQKQKAEIQ